MLGVYIGALTGTREASSPTRTSERAVGIGDPVRR